MSNDETAAPTLTVEKRHRWVTNEPVPEGWRRGNQCFIAEGGDEYAYLDVFFYDPAVGFRDRLDDGSTDRWIRFHKVYERRYVSEWEAADA